MEMKAEIKAVVTVDREDILRVEEFFEVAIPDKSLRNMTYAYDSEADTPQVHAVLQAVW